MLEVCILNLPLVIAVSRQVSLSLLQPALYLTVKKLITHYTYSVII